MKSKVTILLLLASLMVIGSLSGCGFASNDEAETAAQEEEESITIEAEANEYYEAGCVYLYGMNGMEVDFESAYTNFEKAAELDYSLAMEWYLKAAELGDANAMNYIAYMYDFGLGVEQDSEIAFEWYEKAANLGN